MARTSPSFPRFLHERRRPVPYALDPVGALAEEVAGDRRFLPASPRSLLRHLPETGASPAAFAAAQLAAVEYRRAVEARQHADATR